jgi:hypothetical protein
VGTYRWAAAAGAALLIITAAVLGTRWWLSSSPEDCGLPPGDNSAGTIASPGSASAAADYWTPERMRSARPAPMPNPDTPPC